MIATNRYRHASCTFAVFRAVSNLSVRFVVFEKTPLDFFANLWLNTSVANHTTSLGFRPGSYYVSKNSLLLANLALCHFNPPSHETLS